MLKDTLQKVLNEAHRGHTYVSDLDKHGKLEHWEADLVGDCDSFALWIRDRLKQENIESDLIYCLTETGEGHLVISVQGWILDNRSKWVRRRDDIPYTWLRIGKPDGYWFTIKS